MAEIIILLLDGQTVGTYNFYADIVVEAKF
jgi:hypothetical protein